MAMNTNHKMKFCDGQSVKTVVIYIKKQLWQHSSTFTVRVTFKLMGKMSINPH